MTLEHLILSVELQSCIIKVYDYEKEEYTASIPYTYENAENIINRYGSYYVKFIYPEIGAAVVEIADE